MDGSKGWYLSRGAWANLLQIMTGFGVMEHVLTSQQAAIIAVQGPAVIVTAIVAVLGLVGLWGRLVATKKLTA